MMNITVYMGAYEGNDRRIREAAVALGNWIGSEGNTLIYGGSAVGMMGLIAKSVIESGGKAIGVEPRFFIEKNVQYDALTELIITDDFPERRTKMIELGEAFIAFPGGTGTLDEISEIMTLSALDRLKAPCILYNLNGYYDGIKIQLQQMIKSGFSTEKRQERIYFPEDLEQLQDILKGTVG